MNAGAERAFELCTRMPHPERHSGLLLRPSVALTLAWATLTVAWLLFALATTPAPAPGEPWRFLEPGRFALGSLLQGLLALALWIDLRWARRAPPGLRRAQSISVVAALVLLAQLQVLGTLAYAGGTL